MFINRTIDALKCYAFYLWHSVIAKVLLRNVRYGISASLCNAPLWNVTGSWLLHNLDHTQYCAKFPYSDKCTEMVIYLLTCLITTCPKNIKYCSLVLIQKCLITYRFPILSQEILIFVLKRFKTMLSCHKIGDCTPCSDNKSVILIALNCTCYTLVSTRTLSTSFTTSQHCFETNMELSWDWCPMSLCVGVVHELGSVQYAVTMRTLLLLCTIVVLYLLI